MGLGELLVKNLKSCEYGPAFGQLAWLLFYLACSETQVSHLLKLGILDLVLDHLQKLSSSIRKNVFSLTALLRIIGKRMYLGLRNLRKMQL